MAKGFGIIATKDGQLFIEPDKLGDVSHNEILKRAGIEENTSLQRDFVKVQFPDWTENSFRWNEDETLPIWADEEMEERCKKLLLRVAPIWDEYNKVCGLAEVEYNKIYAQAVAEYKEVKKMSWAGYEKVRVQTGAGYEKVRALAGAKYNKACTSALAEYGEVRAAALADMAKELSTITGYVPELEVK